jgi:hypothetical protein
VVVDVLGDVEHEFVKDHEPLASLDLLVVLGRRDIGSVFLNNVLVVFVYEASVVVLIYSHRQDNEKQVSHNKPRSFMKTNLGIQAEHTYHDTGADRCLNPKEHKVAEVHVDSLGSEHSVCLPFIASTSFQPCENTTDNQQKTQCC